ncbi:MAG: Hpt domain-containing protein, partial [Thermoplasmata archaeon]|nr:Hpt domain-containing protein [Thermoplasmata archaeon]
LTLAVDTGNAEKVRRAAHRFKSSAAELGASGLARTLAELEARARAGDLSTSEALLQRATEQLTSVRPALGDLARGSAPGSG